jgi:2-iminobutanoate/2-iminopropanoate deaminase
MKEMFQCNEIAKPIGPFSPAVRGAGLTLLSGQVAQEPATGKLVEGDAAAQAEVILRNVSAVLRAAGRTWADVLRVGVYLTDMADFSAVNAVYQRHVPAPYPARTAIAVRSLPLGAAVEMDVMAG